MKIIATPSARFARILAAAGLLVSFTSLTAAAAVVAVPVPVPAPVQAPGAATAFPGVVDGIMASSLAPNVEHFVRLAFKNSHVDIAKVNVNGRMSQVAADMTGRIIPVQTVRDEYDRPLRAFGKIHPRLARRMISGEPKVRVAVGLKLADTPASLERPLDSTNMEADLTKLGLKYASLLSAFEARKKAAVARLKLSPAELVTRLEKNLPGSPFVVVTVAPQRISQLAALPDVGLLFSYETDGRNDLEAALAVAGADTAQADGLTGKGVKAAVFETSPDDTSELTIEAKFSTEEGTTASLSGHTRHVTGIIRNNNDVGGFAPQAKIFSADSYDLDALDWAVDKKRVSVVNQSFHRGNEIGDGMQFDDFYKDLKLLHYPWTLVVQAAGNWTLPGSDNYEGGQSVLDEFVNHKCFNHLSVGNHNDDASAMSRSSCMVNPTSTHADRELPEICANGVGVTAVGLSLSGTSMASPAVAGSVALLQEKKPILKIWPEGVRALLLAGSLTNVPLHDGLLPDGSRAADAPDTWWNDVRLGRDAFDGAGAMNINRSVLIASRRTGQAGTSTIRGWDIGRMVNTSFDSSSFAKRTYTVEVPSLPRSGRMLRVALAWDNTSADMTNPLNFFRSEPNMDLDIRVFEVSASGALTRAGVSLSYDNSYEVADVPVKPGSKYVIKIHRWKGGATDWTWFGAAWDLR